MRQTYGEMVTLLAKESTPVKPVIIHLPANESEFAQHRDPSLSIIGRTVNLILQIIGTSFLLHGERLIDLGQSHDEKLFKVCIYVSPLVQPPP